MATECGGCGGCGSPEVSRSRGYVVLRDREAWGRGVFDSVGVAVVLLWSWSVESWRSYRRCSL